MVFNLEITMFMCSIDFRYSATATLGTVGALPPMADPSAVQQWPTRNLDVKVSKTQESSQYRVCTAFTGISFYD